MPRPRTAKSRDSDPAGAARGAAWSPVGSILLLALLAIAARPGPVRGAPAAAPAPTGGDPAAVTGVVFVAQPVRAPVAPDRVLPVPPFVPAGVPEQSGEVAVGPDRAAALWLDPLDVVRVRHQGALRFARLAGGEGARARIDEPGAAIAPGVTYLAQPPGRGDVWMIWAERAAAIRVERPIARDGRVIWDDTQRAVLEWIDRGGAPADHAAIPIADGAYGAALQLEADAVLGAQIEAAWPEPRLARAVRAWRKSSVVAALTAVRPLVAPQLALTPLDDLAGMGGDVTVPDPRAPAPRPYQRVGAARPWKLRLDGPGALRVEVRAILPALAAAPSAGVAAEPPTVTVAVSAEGRRLGRRSIGAAYATAPPATDPPPAFPLKEPLRSAEGDYLGDRVAVSVPLLPGSHEYEIAVEGAPLAVRATAARRRVRIGEALGDDDVDDFARAALAALDGQAGDGAALVRRLVASRAPAPKGTAEAPAAADPGSWRPLLRLAWHAAAAQVAGRDQLVAMLRAQPAPAGPEVWALVLQLARRLADPDDVRAIYQAVRGAPPPSLVPELTQLLPRATPLERIRNWPLAAAEVASRARPVDPAIASAAHAAWRTGEWSLIAAQLRDPDAEPPPPRRWLVEGHPSPMTPPRAWRPGDLTRLAPGKPRKVTALPSAIDAGRAALLDVFVASDPGDPGPIRVTVDGRAFHAFALAPLERIQIAAAPGPHVVELAGPEPRRAEGRASSSNVGAGSPGLRGWISQLPEVPAAIEDTARVQRYWPPSEGGARLQYALPGGELPAPIEVAVRALHRPGGAPIRVTLRADVGRPVELELAATSPDARSYPLDAAPGEAAAAEEIRFVHRLEPGARLVWFETADPERVFVSVSARRERFVAPPAAAPPRAATAADLVARVAASSRALAADPDDARTRASRANDLLDLGEAGLAREDLIALARAPAARRDAALAAVEEELFARADSFAEPTHISLAAPAAAAQEPVPVAPALLAVATEADLGRWQPAARALRAGNPDEALRAVAGAPDDPVAVYLAARAHLARGDDTAGALELVRLYQRTDRWPAGLEAIDPLARVVSDRKRPPRAGLVALTYGVAARVRGALDHPRLRRALVVAAVQSGWDTVTATSSNAGQEHVFSSAPALPPAPAVVIREAMLSPRWPARSAHTLTAGNAAVLDLTVPQATTIRAQVHCVRLRASQKGDGPCTLTARTDNGAARPLSVSPGAPAEVALDPVGAGRHVVEVALGAASEGDAASVRFVADRALPGLTAPPESGEPLGLERSFHPIRIDRRAKLFAATAAAPITATLLGPTTLWVQGRAVISDADARPGPASPRTLEIVAAPVKRGPSVRAQLALPAERDADARGDAGRDLALSGPADAFLVLPEAGAYQITIRPDRGELLARMALRDERRGKIPRLPGPWYAAAPPTAAPFALPTPPAAARIDGAAFAPPRTGRIGTLSLELGASQDTRSDEDLAATGLSRNSDEVFGRLEGAAAYRRALSLQRAWLAMRALVRSRERTALVAGGSAELYADALPLGTTLQLAGTAYTQAFSDGRAWHVRGDARLSRRFAASDTVTVIPGLGLGASYLNTTPQIASEAEPDEQVDPDVYSDYRYAHDLGGAARLAIRWLPFQDFAASIGASATTNRNLASLDHATLSVETRALLPLPLVGETLIDLGYRPSFRFADADRMTAYTRHDLSARLEWTLWTGTAGRFVLALWDELLLAAGPSSQRNALGAALRFDLVRHRGLADFRPDEAPFASLVEHRCYAPVDLR